MTWTRICGIDDVPMLGARVIERPLHAGGNIAVFRTATDAVFALVDRCPHKGGPLSQGIVHGERVACPLHGWNVELDTGCAVAPDRGCAQRFPVRVETGVVYLELAPSIGNAANEDGVSAPEAREKRAIAHG
jgi:nitrite reductase (NADH) small subunit